MGLGDRFKKLFGSGKDKKKNKTDEIIDKPIKIEDNWSFEESAEAIDGEAPENEPDVSDLSAESFTYLESLIKAGANEIVLDSDIILKDDESLKYSSGIDLDVDDVVIDGAGHIIDARQDARIFYCTANNVTLKNITLKNGFAKEGGAICNEGDLTIVNCSFSKNVAYDGGSILNKSGKLKVDKSSFSDCTIKKTSIGEGGSAIRNLGEATIKDSCFSGHYIHEDLFGTNGVLTNYKGKLNVMGCDFCNITSDESISAVFNSYGDAVIENSLFSKNSLPGGIIYSDGYSDSGKCTINNCSFIKNSKSKSIIFTKAFSTIAHSIFEGNESKNVLFNKGTTLVVKAKFLGNDINNAVVFHNHGYCTLEECSFSNNIHDEDSKNIKNQAHLTLKNIQIAEDGKTILNEDYIFLKNSSEDFNSRIEGDGEVETDVIPDSEVFDFEFLDMLIHSSQSKQIVLSEDFCLQPYETEYYEGGIELDIDGMTIDGAGMTIDGGGKSRIFIITGKDITLKNITFKNGKCLTNNLRTIRNDGSNNNGGAIRVTSAGENLTIDNCTFENNQTRENGGAIDNFRADGLKICGCEFIENSAGVFGGAVNNHEGKMTISGSAMSSNNGMYGGAINGYGGELTVSGSVFHENSAKYGGVAYLRFSNVVMKDSRMYENKARYENTHTLASYKSSLSIDESCSMDWTVAYASSDPYLYEFM